MPEKAEVMTKLFPELTKPHRFERSRHSDLFIRDLCDCGKGPKDEIHQVKS